MMVGLAVKDLTLGMKNGALEMAIIFTIYLIVGTKLHGSFRRAVALPLLGYGFAWVGHFFYEKNHPATFTYPTFSLLGDFRMWFSLLRKYSIGLKNFVIKG